MPGCSCRPPQGPYATQHGAEPGFPERSLNGSNIRVFRPSCKTGSFTSASLAKRPNSCRLNKPSGMAAVRETAALRWAKSSLSAPSFDRPAGSAIATSLDPGLDRASVVRPVRHPGNAASTCMPCAKAKGPRAKAPRRDFAGPKMVFRTDRPGTHRQCTTLSIPDLSGDPSGRSRLAR
jgi:hypothetical protein